MALSGAQIMGLVGGLLGGLLIGGLGFRLTQSSIPTSPSKPAVVSKEVTYSVRTEPFGATILIDNQVIGTAPMILSFAPTPEKSKYTLTFSHPGFASTQIEYLAEKDTEATITLKAQ
jgi:PEGA domain